MTFQPPPPAPGGLPPYGGTGAPPWAPAPPPPRRSRTGLVIVLGLIGALVLVLLVVGLATVGSRVTGGTALEDLRRGDCFNTTKALVAQKADRVDCATPHSDQVAGILTFPAGDDAGYPGQEGILEFAGQACGTQTAEFFGSVERPPSTQTFVFGPNEAAWKGGDRTVVCSVREESGAKRTGSYLDR